MSESTLELAVARNLPPSTQAPARGALARAVALVSDDLAATELRLRELLRSEVASIPAVGGHLTFAGGKRFRPLLTLLAARAARFEGASRITAAAVGELLHTATLLHDDVIDGGEFRRGRPAARTVFGNGMAVLTGDYCLARALQAMAHDGDLAAVQTMSDMVTRMAEGEVAQLEVAGDWGMDRARYYAVIERKTAALIAWCASVGGLVGADQRAALEGFGRELGFAFQIADDVLDVRSDAEASGKTRAQDLREGKATLPLLIACERDLGVRSLLENRLGGGPPVDDEVIFAIVDRLENTGALDAADEIAQTHARNAIAHLAALNPSPARDALSELAFFVARRDG